MPPAVRAAGANAGDHAQLPPAVLDLPKGKGMPGRPKELTEDLYADRGHDSRAAKALPRLGVEPHTGRRVDPHGSSLGKVRRAAERTLSRLEGPRRMRVRHDRSEVTRDAWTSVAASVICHRVLGGERPLAV